MKLTDLTETKESNMEMNTHEHCVHHWIIEPPCGPVSKGICIKCDSQKDFHNNIFVLSALKTPRNRS